MASRPISPECPFESKFVEVHGSKMHFIQEDNPHGIGADLARSHSKLQPRLGGQ